MEHTILIHDGKIEFVYSDELAPLLELGDATVERVSHVEPSGKGWLADMAPVGGPIIGVDGTSADVDWRRVCDACWQFPNRCDHVALQPTPFKTRAEALAAERAWLAEHKGL